MAAIRHGKRGGRTLPHSLDRRLATYSLPSLLTLATAAGASPTVRHRWPSVGHLTARSLALPNHGSKAVTPALLEQLVIAARRDEPGIVPWRTSCRTTHGRRCSPGAGTGWSGCFPVRSSALSRMWSGQTWSQQPSTSTSFRVWASASVTMSMWDCCTSITRSVSSALSGRTGDVTDLDAPPFISGAEYAAAATLVLQPPPADIIGSAARAAALRFATSPAAALPYEPDHPQSAFSRYLAVSLPPGGWPQLPRTSGQCLWWLPPAFIRMRLVTAFPLWRGTLPVMSAAQDDSLSWLPAGRAGRCGGSAIFSVRLTTSLALWSHLGM